MPNTRLYYIYTHYYASGSNKGKPFYVGKGTKQRITTKHCRSKYWTNIVNKYGFETKIIAKFTNEIEAYTYEILEILYLKSEGYKLCNISVGGLGASSGTDNAMYGRKGKLSPMWGKKRPDLVIKNKQRTGHKNPMYGKTGKLNPMWGKKRPDLVIRNKQRIGVKNPNFGKKNEFLTNFNKQRTGEKHPNFKGYWHCGKYGKFASKSSATKATGISNGGITHRCKTKYFKWKDWYFEPVKKGLV
ncbi:MAG: hypothetical protein OXF77_00900 [Thaumarchaeota archaeon]|nr:hypothetical protein [Nitrososphaerota archaeon]